MVLIPGVWANPKKAESIMARDGTDGKTPEQLDEEFKAFFTKTFNDCAQFGEVEDFVVVENTADHLLGNVMVKFHDEEDAKKCVEGLAARALGGGSGVPEFSPVMDTRDAQCRQFESKACARGLACNFLHYRQLPNHRALLRELILAQPHRGERSNAGASGSNKNKPSRGARKRSRSPPSARAASDDAPAERERSTSRARAAA